MSDLVISDLHVDVLTEEDPRQIPRGVDLTMSSGEVYVIMGPNGPGKFTLAYAIAGHPKYEITSGSVTLDGVELADLAVNEHARQDLFLATRCPVKVSGVSMASFLHTAKTALDGKVPKIRTQVKDARSVLNRMNLDSSFFARSVSEGFSGGGKKRHEIAQLKLLSPRAAILDETDSGLDIDTPRVVSGGMNRYSAQRSRAVMLITHYTRIPRYIDPVFMHIFVGGHVIDQGGCELADRLKAEGYEAYIEAAAANV